MRGPQPAALVLTANELQFLTQFARRHTTPQQLAQRARIILAADDGLNNAQIARREAISLPTVRLWRTRWLALSSISQTDLPLAERLTDAPRSGAPATITAEQVCQIVALACEPPADGGARSASGQVVNWPTKYKHAAL